MERMSYVDFAARRDADDLRLIDVRESHEFMEVRVKGAELFALSRIQSGEIPNNDSRRVALICRSGMRSAMAAQVFESQGFQDVINVEGGTLAAIAQGAEHVER